MQDLQASCDIRSAVGELRQILNTPLRSYESTANDETERSVSGRRSSESESLSDADLPGLVTRVLGKR